jgi:hypothetical protein
MEHIDRNPRADQQQSMARKAAKQIVRDIRRHIAQHPFGSSDHVICPDSGHGAWILHFLNKELAKHGLIAEFWWDETNRVRKYKVQKLGPLSAGGAASQLFVWVMIIALLLGGFYTLSGQ